MRTRCGPLDLRHAFATFLLDQGEELRTVMELLGHSTIRMTADTYGHACRRGLVPDAVATQTAGTDGDEPTAAGAP